LQAAADLIERQHYAIAVFHMQQSIEKIAKTIAALKGEFISGHEVSGWLALEISGEIDNAKEIVIFLKEIEDLVNKTRYPFRQRGKIVSPMELISQDYATNALSRSQHVSEHLLNYLKVKFNFQLDSPNQDNGEEPESDARNSNEG
jgi:HEPN domain-containing protein